QVQVLQFLDSNAVVTELGKMLPQLIGEDIELVIAPGEQLSKIKADPVQLQQIIMNLAANARDAMPDGGEFVIQTSNVQLDDSYIESHSMVTPGHYVMLAISDSGHGIDPENMPHIFEPFFTTKEE